MCMTLKLYDTKILSFLFTRIGSVAFRVEHRFRVEMGMLDQAGQV